MAVDVKVSFDLKGAERKLSPESFKRGQIAMANQMLIDMNRYVPRRSGNLRASGSVNSNGSRIIYKTVYARAQYYGTNGIVTFKKYKTGGTGSQWLSKATGIHSQRWINVASSGMGLR